MLGQPRGPQACAWLTSLPLPTPPTTLMPALKPLLSLPLDLTSSPFSAIPFALKATSDPSQPPCLAFPLGPRTARDASSPQQLPGVLPPLLPSPPTAESHPCSKRPHLLPQLPGRLGFPGPAGRGGTSLICTALGDSCSCRVTYVNVTASLLGNIGTGWNFPKAETILGSPGQVITKGTW